MSFWDWAGTLAGMLRQSGPLQGEPVTGHAQDRERHGVLTPYEIDAEGWLVAVAGGARLQIVPSVRHSALTTPRGPHAIVFHYTATDVGTAKNLAKRIRTYKRGKDRAASWHVCIGADGTLWQSVSFLRGSWHCAKGAILGHRVNACSVGVELEGHGKEFPAAQIEAAGQLVRALRETYDIHQSEAGRGHVEFDPARRSDPGPVWKALLPDLLERAYR